jgi:TRAP-type mannitol/chloroaromatic compound transport system permease large subunit
MGYIIIFLPVTIVITYSSIKQAIYSFHTFEVSDISPWRPLMWPFRTSIALGFILLTIQVMAEMMKNLLTFLTERMEGIMDNLLVVASMFPVLFFLIFMGFPVSFCFIGLSLFYSLGFFGSAIGMQLVGRVYDVGTNYSYAAIPLFIFMGTLLEHSGIAERLFGAINLWTGRIPGGLAVSTIIMSAIIAAASGIIGAVEVLVGLLAIPAMIKYSYDKGLISGTICAGGALGTIIPPSLVAVVYAPIANVSMGALLIGIIAPGLMLACIYIIYILVRCTIYPEDGPRVSKEEMLKYSFKEK